MAMRIPTNIKFSGRASASSLLIAQTIIVVLLIIITLHTEICKAQITMCNNVSYTKGGKYERNLNTVLNTLVQHTSQTGFNTSVYGRSTNRVYGLLQCRGDATAEQCYNCSQTAAITIRQSQISCGNAIRARIWMDDCFLRYDNYSFFGKLDTVGLYLTYNMSNVSNPNVFDAALERLFNNLSAEAASGSGYYASGTTIDSMSRKIYGLVQCWSDISNSNCTTCLSKTINSNFSTYPGRPGAQGLMGSCIVRYEIYPFFHSTALPLSHSPAGVPASTPVANTPPKQIRVKYTDQPVR